MLYGSQALVFISINVISMPNELVKSIQVCCIIGIQVFALTNQTHIEKGDLNYHDLFNSLISMGFDDAFICPHSENTNCNCRKPQKGLIDQAHVDYCFENHQAIIIGDRYSSDIKLAQDCRMLGIHVATGKHELCQSVNSGSIEGIVKVETLQDAVDYILT